MFLDRDTTFPTGLAGWTLTQTGGTVTGNNIPARMLLAETDANDNTWNRIGSVRTTPQTVASGNVIFGQFMVADVTITQQYMFVLARALSLTNNFSNTCGGFVVANNLSLYDDSSGTIGSVTITSATWYDFSFTFLGNGKVRMDYRVTLGNAPGNLWGDPAAFTTVGTSSLADFLAISLYSSVNYKTKAVSSTYSLADFFYTDNGTPTPPAPSSFAKGMITTSAPRTATIPFTWVNNGNAASQSGFYLYESIDGGAFSLAHDVNSAVATSYSYAALQGHHYQFKLDSYVSVGTIFESSFTSTLTFDSPVDPPTNLVATAVGETEIDLEWDSTTDGWEDGFSIERSLTSGSGFSEIGTTNPAELAYQDITALPGTTYYYRVRSFWDVANPPTIFSSYTSTATATTTGGEDTGADMLALGEL